MWGWIAAGVGVLYLLTHKPASPMAPPPSEKKINLPDGDGASLSIGLGGRVAVFFTTIPQQGKIAPSISGDYRALIDDDPRNEDRGALVTPQGRGRARIFFTPVSTVDGQPIDRAVYFDLEVT